MKALRIIWTVFYYLVAAAVIFAVFDELHEPFHQAGWGFLLLIYVTIRHGQTSSTYVAFQAALGLDRHLDRILERVGATEMEMEAIRADRQRAGEALKKLELKTFVSQLCHLALFLMGVLFILSAL